MTISPDDRTLALAMLDCEWNRIDAMLGLAEAVRTGDALDADFSERFDTLCAHVEQARTSGAWAGLSTHIAADALAGLTRLDLDLLVLALAPVARPAFGPRIQSLQPHLATPWPGLPLTQEMLGLSNGAEIAALFDRLHPTAPLAALGLMQVEGATPGQILRPRPLLIRALLNRDAELAPPPGATPSLKTGDWDQLVLPPQTLRQLGHFSAWVHRARQVQAEWGAGPVYGPLALFSGPSGTGKSFAASVIVQDLMQRTGEKWTLYSLDLGRIMSKYVGETEANLNALLDALEGRNALLQIDEADGLLGKRGEVSDARDRYANLEVSHMLARFERHAGPVILTTNLRSNVDSAFLRRFQLVVDFPSPDAAARARLWQVLLPPRAPVADEVEFEALGTAVRLSGGAIRNAALYASVLAAEEDCPIGFSQLARAIRAELGKEARQVRSGEIGFLSAYLEEAS